MPSQLTQKNEFPNPGHGPFHSSVGKKVVHSTTNKIRHRAIQHKGRDSIESLHDFGSRITSIQNSNFHIPHIMDVTFNQVLVISIHPAMGIKGNVCIIQSMKTASSHSPFIQQKKLTERRFLNYVIRSSLVPKLGERCNTFHQGGVRNQKDIQMQETFNF
jgi:hypothetical protein